MLVHSIIEAINPNVTFQHSEDIEANANVDKRSAWIVHEIGAYIGDEKAGYLKISYIPKEKVKELYPTILNYLLRQKGMHILPWKYADVPYTKIPVNVLRDSLESAVIHLGNYPTREQLDQFRTMSDEQVKAVWTKLEKDASKRFGKDYKEFINFHVNKPMVDFIRVYPEFKRQGVGEALYREGHRWMKEKGMKLYASGTQSEEAKAAWERMATRYKIDKEVSNKNVIPWRYRKFFAD